MFESTFELLKLPLHADKRGGLFEMLKFTEWGIPGAGHIYCFTVVPGARRADHYHEKKREWFSCVAGEVTVLLEDREGKKARFLLNAAKPSVLYIAPYTVHAVLNHGDQIAAVVAYGSTPFDSKDTDTIRQIVTYDESI